MQDIDKKDCCSTHEKGEDCCKGHEHGNGGCCEEGHQHEGHECCGGHKQEENSCCGGCKGEENVENLTEKEIMELKIKELEAELEIAKNDYFKLYADMDNLRKRLLQDQAVSLQYALQDVINDILPTIDNFERALASSANDAALEQYSKGFEMIKQGLMTVLEKHGVKVIESVGLEFDPTVHQAIMQVDDEGFESNIVVEEMQKGYMLHDRLIRPSLVKVKA